MITSETGLVDANVLVYAINENAKQLSASLKLVESGLNGEIPVCFTPQVFSEFFATYNEKDFLVYSEIEVLNPESVIH